MKDYIVFSLSQNKKLAREVAGKLHAEVGRVSITRFSDGELMVKAANNVKNKTAIVIESTFKQAHERIFELLLLLDSINRSGASSVQLFIPYFGYSRQERVSWINEPVSCEVVSKVIETAKYDSLVTFDLHHPDIEKFFIRPIVNASTSDLFAEYYLNYIKEHNIDINDVVIVSPDHGANTRADYLMHRIGGTKVILDKVRPKPNLAEHLVIDGKLVKDKVCIIIDDIIDTGGTIISAAKLLYENGAKNVLVGATHAVFSTNCLTEFCKAHICDIVVTNTIEQRSIKGVTVLDICPLVIDQIK